MGAAIFYKNGAIVENCVIANNASTRGANGTKDGQGVIQGHTKGDATYEVNRFINCTIVNNVADIYTIFLKQLVQRFTTVFVGEILREEKITPHKILIIIIIFVGLQRVM